MATQTQTTSSRQYHGFPVQRLSRYSSVRQAAARAEISPPDPAAWVPSASKNESVKRSMSRYRKRPSKSNAASLPPLPPQPTSPTRVRQVHAESLSALTGEPCPQDGRLPMSPPRNKAEQYSRRRSDSKNATSPRKLAPAQGPSAVCPSSPKEGPPYRRPLSWESTGEANTQAERPSRSSPQATAGVLNNESEHTRQLQAHRAASREAKLVARRGTERRHQERAPGEQNKRPKPEYEHREQATTDRSHPEEEWRRAPGKRANTVKQGSTDIRRGNTIREKLGFLTSKKSVEVLRSEESPRRPAKNDHWDATERTGIAAEPLPGSVAHGSKTTPSNFGIAAWVDAPTAKPLPEHAAPGSAAWVDAPVSRPKLPNSGPVVVPQYDAPVSAVNAGERHVLVEWDNSRVTLPVTPSTTSTDLINSAASNMSDSIDPRTSKLVECFAQLGLERSLRHYEHVRDVMNSWDSDAQHAFVILPTTHDQDKELGPKNAPKKQPGETSVYMYHSQRPGSWDKRWITLRSDGQVTTAKRRGHETSNICHLSDFDIYRPTPRQQSKRIKPPKKICFAVKSLQKSNMFLDGSNFVHFFATNDRDVAAQWYQAVQGWRSWYLVDILGDVEVTRHESTKNTSNGLKRSASHRRPSTDPSPYARGSSSQPRLDSNGEYRSSTNNSSASRPTKSAEAFKQSSRDRAAPPSAFPNKQGNDPDPRAHQGSTPDGLESSTFAPAGLLGRTYSHKQKSQRERESSHKHSRTDSAPATSNLQQQQQQQQPPPPPPPASALTRKPTTKAVPAPTSSPGQKPLVDLTPQYQEPPQHVKKGKGVSAAPGQRLVDAATGLELEPGAIVTPSARAWRRPEVSPPLDGITRTRTLDHSAVDPTSFFTDPNSLSLGRKASTASRRPGQRTGHGVRPGTATNEQRPLLDLKMDSRFADGSLLRKVEEGKVAGTVR